MLVIPGQAGTSICWVSTLCSSFLHKQESNMRGALVPTVGFLLTQE